MLATSSQHCNSYPFPSLPFDHALNFQPHIMSFPFNNNSQLPVDAHATSTSTSTSEDNSTILFTSFLNEGRTLNNQEYLAFQEYHQPSPHMPSLDTPVVSPVFSDLLSNSIPDQYLTPYYSPASDTMSALNQVPETFEPFHLNTAFPFQMSYLACPSGHAADITCEYCSNFQPGLFSPASSSASSSPTVNSYMNPNDSSTSRRGGRISPSTSSHSSSHRRSSSPSTASPSSSLSRNNSGGSNSSVTRRSPPRQSGRYSGKWKYWNAPR